MNRVQAYGALISRLRQRLPPDLVEHVTVQILAIANFDADELRQIGIAEPRSDTFTDAMPDPPRRSTYSRRTVVGERS